MRVEVSDGGAKLAASALEIKMDRSHMPNTSYSRLGPITDDVWRCMISRLSTAAKHLRLKPPEALPYNSCPAKQRVLSLCLSLYLCLWLRHTSGRRVLIAAPRQVLHKLPHYAFFAPALSGSRHLARRAPSLLTLLQRLSASEKVRASCQASLRAPGTRTTTTHIRASATFFTRQQH